MRVRAPVSLPPNAHAEELTRDFAVAKQDDVSPVGESYSGPTDSSKDATIAASGNFSDEKGSKEHFSVSSAVDDAAALPKGTIDPVYEAKARVLNHAVSLALLH